MKCEQCKINMGKLVGLVNFKIDTGAEMNLPCYVCPKCRKIEFEVEEYKE